MRALTPGRTLKLYEIRVGRREEVGDFSVLAGEPPIVGDAEQHMRRPAAVSDEHRAFVGGLLGLAGTLIECAAGDGRDRDGYAPV